MARNRTTRKTKAEVVEAANRAEARASGAKPEPTAKMVEFAAECEEHFEPVEVELPPSEEPELRAKSVVPHGYKRAYVARALAEGRTTKAAKRCNGDWLARELEAECVNGGSKFDFDRFVQILEANGIDGLARWTNRNNGWQGRFRMSGAIVLRGVVKKTGVLVTPETTIEVPAEFRD